MVTWSKDPIMRQLINSTLRLRLAFDPRAVRVGFFVVMRRNFPPVHRFGLSVQFH